MDYYVTFRTTAEMTEAQANATLAYQSEEPYTLEEARAICISTGYEADLYDAAGFRKGWIHADGNYTLQ